MPGRGRWTGIRRNGAFAETAYRRSFLEDVPENARSLALARALLGEPAPVAS